MPDRLEPRADVDIALMVDPLRRLVRIVKGQDAEPADRKVRFAILSAQIARPLLGTCTLAADTLDQGGSFRRGRFWPIRREPLGPDTAASRKCALGDEPLAEGVTFSTAADLSTKAAGRRNGAFGICMCRYIRSTPPVRQRALRLICDEGAVISVTTCGTSATVFVFLNDSYHCPDSGHFSVQTGVHGGVHTAANRSVLLSVNKDLWPRHPQLAIPRAALATRAPADPSPPGPLALCLAAFSDIAW